ncbi:hypothetical protein D3C76_1115110 [compost metagenome]
MAPKTLTPFSTTLWSLKPNLLFTETFVSSNSSLLYANEKSNPAKSLALSAVTLNSTSSPTFTTFLLASSDVTTGSIALSVTFIVIVLDSTTFPFKLTVALIVELPAFNAVTTPSFILITCESPIV